MDGSLFIEELDGLTFSSLEELETYEEWVELARAGS